jgi:hypothetical protein
MLEYCNDGVIKVDRFRVQRLQLLEIPNRRRFDVFPPGTLNREPISLGVSL